MARRKGSKAWWDEQLADYYLRRSEVSVRGFAKEIGVTHGALGHRLYSESKSLQREKAKRAASLETRLVEVDVIGLPAGSDVVSPRWLEAETPRGMRVRFPEGTGSEYVVDLMTRIAARGA